MDNQQLSLVDSNNMVTIQNPVSLVPTQMFHVTQPFTSMVTIGQPLSTIPAPPQLTPAPGPHVNAVSTSSTGVTNNHRDWILEAIDKLRERKARPDAEKIGLLLKRNHNISAEETQICLNQLADIGEVVCVDYKGNVSYRNPSKWRKVSSGSGGVLNTPTTSKRILEVVRWLTDQYRQANNIVVNDKVDPVDLSSTSPIAQSSNKATPGFTLAEIEQALQGNKFNGTNKAQETPGSPTPSPSELTGLVLRTALERESIYGGLLKQLDGRYGLDESGIRKKPPPPKKPKSSLSTQKTPSTTTSSTPFHNPVQPVPIFSSHTQVSMSQGTPMNATTGSGLQTQMYAYTTPTEIMVPMTAHQALPQGIQPLYQVPQNLQLSQHNMMQPGHLIPQHQMAAHQTNTMVDIKPVILPDAQVAPPVPELNQSNTVSASASNSSNVTLGTPMSSSKPSSGGSGSGKSGSGKRGRPPGSKNKKMPPGSEPLMRKVKLYYSDDGKSEHADIKNHSMHGCRKCGSEDTSIEDFLVCKDCSFKAHPSCLGYWAELTERARRSPWQCTDCKTCCICQDPGAPEQMLICDTCDKGFHINCHHPRVTHPEDSEQAWVCNGCSLEGHKVAPSYSSQGITSPHHTAVSSQQSFNTNGTSSIKSFASCDTGYQNQSNHNGDIYAHHGGHTNGGKPDGFGANQIHNNNNAPQGNSSTGSGNDEPDPRGWTVEDVANWLTTEGFQREARAFKEQEIDGPCLLLMKRMDVLTELGIKLGPAVKIYERIKRLQSRGAWSYADVY